MDSALRASPLRGALRASVGRSAASDELTRAIHGPRPAGALRASKTAVLPFCRYARSLLATLLQTKKGHPLGDPFPFVGGGGENRTRVRKPSASRSTCLFRH